MKNFYLSLLGMLITLSLFSQGSGKLLDYNGTSSYVGCGSINMSGQALTLQGWIKVDNFKTSFPYITSLWGTEYKNDQAMVRLGDASLAANKVQFILYINGRITKLNGSKTLSTGKWYHIAATYNGSAMTIYVNGVQDVTMSATGSITSSSPFQIGQNYSADRTIDGQIDEVSVFKAGLTQSTIRSWMCQSIKPSHPNYSNLEAYWKFDKGTGTSVTDHSTKSHTGTFNNSPAWQNSSAAIGDTSISDYATPFNLNLPHANGDSMVVSSVTGAPTSAHLYRVDQKPNSTTFPSTVSLYDSTRYWGVFYTEGTAPKGNIAYHYANNLHYKNTGSCMIDLGNREDNSKTSWTSLNTTQSGSALTKSASTRNEYILTYRSNKIIHKDTGQTICVGDSVKLEHNTVGMTYKWYKNNVLIPGASSNVMQVKTTGIYWLTAGLGTCTDTTYTFNLTTQNNPSVSMPTINSSCPSVLFDTIQGGLPSGGVYLNTYMSGNLFVVKTAGPGNHKITYQYTDQFGCSDTASQMKVVHSWPQIGLSSIPKMCADSGMFNLTNGTPTGGTYYVNGSVGSSFDANALGAGKHSVKYEVTDANSCNNADSIDVDVVGLPTVVLNLIRDKLCEYDNPTSLDGQNPSGGLYSGTGVSGFNYNPKVAGPGRHPVTYTYRDRITGCSNFAVDTFTVVARPARPTITQANNSLISSSSDAYLWYNDAGERQTASTQSYQPEKNGLYYVVVKSNGCISLNSDTATFVRTGIEGFGSSNSVLVYPNPVSDYLNIHSEYPLDINIFDINGKLLFDGKSNGDLKVPVTDFEEGMYILELKKDNQIERKQIVIQH